MSRRSCERQSSPRTLGEIDAALRERDASRLLVLLEPLGVDALDLVEVVVDVLRVVCRLAQHLLEVDVVELEQLADDVEDAVAERLLDLVELLEQALRGSRPSTVFVATKLKT